MSDIMSPIKNMIWDTGSLTWVVWTGAVTGSSGAVQYAEDTASVADEQVIMVGVVRKDAAASLVGTDGDRTELQVDASGALRITGGGGGTEYTEDVAAPADPVGATFMMTRDDQLAVVTEIEGDWSRPRGSSKGALWVAIADSAGDPITSFGGGTQYTEDVPSAADPIGTQLIIRRRDTLSATEVSADGDNIAANSTSKGELYVKHTDAIPVTDNAGSLTVDNATISVVGGGVEATAQRVTIASDSTGVLSVDDNGGSLTVDNATISVVGGGVEATAQRVTIASDSTGVITVKQGTAATSTAGWPVIGGDVARTSAAWTSATALDTTLSLAVKGYGAAVVTVNTTTTITGGALIFEASDDGGTTWFSVLTANPTSSLDATTYTLVASTKIYFVIDSAAWTNVRVRLNPAITGTGTATVAIVASAGVNVPTTIVSQATAADLQVTANAGTNLNTSLLALEAGGNLATLAGAIKNEDVASADANPGVVVNVKRLDTPVANANVSADADYLPLITDNKGQLWIAGSQKEDDPHTSADRGVFVLGVSNAANTAFAADGDYVPIGTDTEGSVRGIGNRAHDAVDAGNPLKVGGRAINAELAAVANLDRADFITDLVGKLITLPYANPENFVSGATSDVTNTTATTIIAAPAAGLRNYVTQITVTNSHATVSTFVNLTEETSGTVLYTGYALAGGGGFSLTLPCPLRMPTTAKAFQVTCVTTGANVRVSASGYKGA